MNVADRYTGSSRRTRIWLRESQVLEALEPFYDSQNSIRAFGVLKLKSILSSMLLRHMISFSSYHMPACSRSTGFSSFFRFRLTSSQMNNDHTFHFLSLHLMALKGWLFVISGFVCLCGRGMGELGRVFCAPVYSMK